MKKLLLGVIFFIPLAFISCGSNSGGAGGGGPITPPPPNTAAKIQSVQTTPTVPSFVLTGMPINTSVAFTINATGNPAPTYSVNGVALTGNSFTAPNSYESKSYDFVAANSAGSDVRKVDVVVTVDPTFAKLAGATAAGKSFRYQSITKQPIGGGTVTDLLTGSCEANDVISYFPYGITITNFGSGTGCASGMSNSTSFTFDGSNPSNMMLHIGSVVPQPDRRVTFNLDGTVTQVWQKDSFNFTVVLSPE